MFLLVIIAVLDKLYPEQTSGNRAFLRCVQDNRICFVCAFMSVVVITTLCHWHVDPFLCVDQCLCECDSWSVMMVPIYPHLTHLLTRRPGGDCRVSVTRPLRREPPSLRHRPGRGCSGRWDLLRTETDMRRDQLTSGPGQWSKWECCERSVPCVIMSLDTVPWHQQRVRRADHWWLARVRSDQILTTVNCLYQLLSGWAASLSPSHRVITMNGKQAGQAGQGDTQGDRAGAKFGKLSPGQLSAFQHPDLRPRWMSESLMISGVWRPGIIITISESLNITIYHVCPPKWLYPILTPDI